MRRPHSPSAARQRARDAERLATVGSLDPYLDERRRWTIPYIDAKTGEATSFLASRLGAVPNIASAFADALRTHASRNSVASINSTTSLYRNLSAGLITFLVETERAEVTLDEIDRPTLHSFIAWLSQVDDEVPRFKRQTRRTYYQFALQVLGLLRSEKNWRHLVVDPAEVPNSPWEKGTETFSAPLVPFGEGELRDVFRFAARAVRETTARVTADLDLLEASDPPLFDLDRRDALLDMRTVLTTDPARFRKLVSVKLPKHRRDRIKRHQDAEASIRPTIKDLAPFIVLFVIAFRLNESTIVAAKRHDFDVRPWVGGDRVFASPYKTRKGGKHRATAKTTREAINPAMMLEFLDRWIGPLRDAIGSKCLFVCWDEFSEPRPFAFDESDLALRTAVIRRHLRRLVAEAGVEAPTVSLTLLRDAVLDLAHVLSGGDLLKVRAAADHSSAETTSDHYITAAGRAREDEMLAKAMFARGTMIATMGLYDPRKEGDDERPESCTPGWSCHRKAEPGLMTNRLDGQCAAYGRCPVCRHGSIDYSSPRACANAHLLVDAIERGFDRMAPEAWLAQLAPIRTHLLDAVLPNFPEAIHRKAAGLSLPKLPSPE